MLSHLIPTSLKPIHLHMMHCILKQSLNHARTGKPIYFIYPVTSQHIHQPTNQPTLNININLTKKPGYRVGNTDTDRILPNISSAWLCCLQGNICYCHVFPLPCIFSVFELSRTEPDLRSILHGNTFHGALHTFW